MKKSSFWKILDKTVPQKDDFLGCRFDSLSNSAFFSIWAPTATCVTLLFYENSSDESFVFSQNLNFESTTGVWSSKINFGEKKVNFYEYLISDENGRKKCLDPYAFSLSADKNDGKLLKAALIDFAQIDGATISRLEKSCATISLPENSPNSQASKSDVIIYETSVRDSTISPDSPETDPNKKGTFAGFPSIFPYLKDLGITHIQLMPVMKFCNTDETNRSFENTKSTRNCNYNWGYDPACYFSPSGFLSSDSENPYTRILELKSLVKKAHEQGLKVILDCVYNHMSRIDFLNDIVPNYYFRLNPDGSLRSNSGCGNDVASEHFMARKLIVDSIKFWVSEYDVDGFRFDLMGLLDSVTVLEAYKKASKIKKGLLFIGEGWKMYSGRRGTVGMDQNYMMKTDDISVFNDEFRDLCKKGGMNEVSKAFLTGGKVNISDLFCNVCGKPVTNYSAKNPFNSVLYLDCHDGLTLHDSLSVNCENQKESSVPQNEFIARKVKLSNSLLLTSQGIAFLHSGQERLRSKPAFQNTDECIGEFVRNSYKSSDDINCIRWNLNETEKSVLDYTKKLIHLRKKHEAFRIPKFCEIQSRIFLMGEFCKDFLLVYKILDPKGDWYLIFNSDESRQNVPLMYPENFDVYVDESDVYVDGKKYGKNRVDVEANSALVLRVKLTCS
ncbi:MAG: pullulanase [Treponemataceae bacterium]|nr:pullulanase [Treponemataceae bacterium]